MRSVWKSDRPPAVRVVTKNVRGDPVASLGFDGREGFDIAGAEAHPFFWRDLARLNRLRKMPVLSQLPQKSSPQGLKPSVCCVPLTARLKPCPDTSCLFRGVLPLPVKSCPGTSCCLRPVDRAAGECCARIRQRGRFNSATTAREPKLPP